MTRYPATTADIITMAATLFGEARGSTHEDRIACAWAMRNRAAAAQQHRARTGRNHPLFGDGTLSAVCRAPWQFSCWNANDPNRPELDRLTAEGTTLPAALVTAGYVECMAAVLEVIAGRAPDPTQGSTHYHTTRMGWPRSWGERKEPVVVIGAHAFYNNVR